MIRKFSLIRKTAVGDGAKDNKAMDRIAQKMSVNSRIVAEIAMGQMADSDLAKAKEAYKAYKSALADFSTVTASPQSAYEVAKQGFEDSATQAKSPVMAAQLSLEAMGNLIDKDGGRSTFSGKGREAFLCLFSHPVDQLWRFTVSKAAGHLQQLWDEQVLAETQGINDRHRVGMLLFGENGFVDRYNREFAGPFLSKSSKRGYYARTMREAGIPFTSDFFNFLSQGKQWISRTETRAKSNYVVDIEAMPTDVNPDARLKPHMTQLTIESSEGEMVLVNRQYPIAQKFNWVPATCGDVILRIMIGDTTLTRKYTGYCAFGKFLADFKNGRKQYTVSDFPEFAPELNRMGVRQIDVIYSFQRHRPTRSFNCSDHSQDGHRLVSLRLYSNLWSAFGEMRIRDNWQWFVWGKHPGIEDFISAGTPTPLFQKFTKWVDSGFAAIINDDILRTRFHSCAFGQPAPGTRSYAGSSAIAVTVMAEAFPCCALPWAASRIGR